jgi:hypothetical protein
MPGGPREERSNLFVLACGLATTILALGGVYLLDKNTTDFEIMGWYANYVIPAGAFLVGLAASSGYGLGSWFSGVKITRGLLWTVVLLQVIAYFIAQYIAFMDLHLVRHGGQAVGFFEYYDFMARHFAWKQNDGSMGQPMGVWGYCFRGLEILGFVGGSLIIPLVLGKQPYCPDCQRYMKTRELVTVPASVPVRKVKKSDAAGQAAYEQEQTQALENGKQTVTIARDQAAAGKGQEFENKLAELKAGSKAARNLPIRFNLRLVHCPRCFAGQYVASLLIGKGNQIKQSEFTRAALNPEFVRSVIQPSRPS